MTRHRWLLLCFVLSLVLTGVLPIQSIMAGSACTGDADCTPCQHCHGCQHGTCGVEERVEITGEAHERAPFVGWNVLCSGGSTREETFQPDGSAVTANEGVGRWTVAGGQRQIAPCSLKL